MHLTWLLANFNGHSCNWILGVRINIKRILILVRNLDRYQKYREKLLPFVMPDCMHSELMDCSRSYTEQIICEIHSGGLGGPFGPGKNLAWWKNGFIDLKSYEMLGS